MAPVSRAVDACPRVGSQADRLGGALRPRWHRDHPRAGGSSLNAGCRGLLGDGRASKFHALFAAMRRAMTDTPRSGTLAESLNSRLRAYFTLRRHLGGTYLDLPRFFLNHRRAPHFDLLAYTPRFPSRT